jgi:hypothetical protein
VPGVYWVDILINDQFPQPLVAIIHLQWAGATLIELRHIIYVFCFFVYLFIYFIYLLIYLFIYLFVYLFIYLSIYLFIYLFTCLFMYIYIYISKQTIYLEVHSLTHTH